MTHRYGIPFVVVFLAALPARMSQQDWRVTLRSYGPVRFGMTVGEASRVLGQELNADTTESCTYLAPASLRHRVNFMVIDGHIARVDVDTVGVETRSGAHVGSTEDEVKQLYTGQIRVEPHPYTGPEGHYLVYVPRDSADTAFGMIFETDGRVVTSYRSGEHAAVQLIEGCS